MVEPIKLATKPDAFDAKTQESVDRCLTKIHEFRDAGTIVSMQVCVIFKSGANWTHSTPIDDTLKMVGALELMRFETLRTYLERVEPPPPPGEGG